MNVKCFIQINNLYIDNFLMITIITYCIQIIFLILFAFITFVRVTFISFMYKYEHKNLCKIVIGK